MVATMARRPRCAPWRFGRRRVVVETHVGAVYPRSMWRGLWPRLRATGVLWSRKGGTFMAASQAFHVALAFFPLLLLAIAVFGLVLRSDSAERVRDRVVELISSEVSPSLAEQIELLLRQVQLDATLGGQLGLLALMASIVSIFYHMQKAFDLIWDVPATEPGRVVAQARSFLVVELRHFVVWLSIGLLLLAVFAASLVTSVLQTVPQLFTVHLGALAIGPSLVASSLVFALVYKTQPRVPVAWRDVWPGAVLAAVVWEIGRQLMAFSVGTSRDGAYGMVGAFLVVMVWLYFANSVLYLGAMFVRATAAERQTRG
jgi:membrane protein